MSSIAAPPRRLVALLGAFLALTACEGRPQNLGQARCDDSYAQGVGPVLQSNCASCHSATVAEGDYRVDSYQAAIARRPDGTPRVRAGDDNSPLLQAARGTLPGGHVAIPQNETSELRTWVVECALKPKPYTTHINGWMDPGNTDQFHGRVLRQAVYNLSGCQACHAQDLSGGIANVACQSCHPSGVMECNTCHGNAANAAPPRNLDYLSATSLVTVGAHQSHVADGPLHKGFSCEVCHTTPTRPEDEGHYQVGGKLQTGPAPVIVRSGFAGAFSWDRTNATCFNSYCHAPCRTPVPHRSTRSGPRWGRVRPPVAAVTETLRRDMDRRPAARPATARPSSVGNRAPHCTPTGWSSWPRRRAAAWAAMGAAITRRLRWICSAARTRRFRPWGPTAST
jgi:hypothetical protein